jgi:DNA modification methylase
VILFGDCLDRLKEVPTGSVDMVLADLPYGTTACKWDVVIPFEPLWAELRRATRERAVVALFGSQPFTTELIKSAGVPFRYELIWEKSNGGGFLNANRMPLKRHENIAIFYRKLPKYHPQKTVGKPYACRSSAAGETTQDQTVAGWITENAGDRHPTSVLRFKNETGLHPTQKPVPLLEWLINSYTNPGDTVLDPTMGSGSTGVAAIQTGRKFIGIERDSKYFETARTRIDGASRALVVG